MAELNCRLVALFTLAIALVYLGSAVFFRHLGHHNSENRHPTSESLIVGPIQPPPPPESILPAAFPPERLINETCLQCICEATTECKPAKCGSTRHLCGIFRISMAYWQDAERPTLEGSDTISFEDEYMECVNNPFCAGRTVESYVRRYKRDCNKDGTTDCYDYAMLHILGPSGCLTTELPSLTNIRMHQCMQRFLHNLPPDKR